MIQQLISQFAADCNVEGGGLFGLTKWYRYLPTTRDDQGVCIPSIENINNTWLIIAAIVEILLRIAAIIAVIMIVYGGFTYVASQGEPDATKKAKDTLVNSLIGLVVAIMSAALVTFVAGSIN